jgi:hypothetical protein
MNTSMGVFTMRRSNWQPIETAPKNTYILVFMEGNVFEANLIFEEGYEQYAHWDFPFADAHGCGCCSGGRDYPTHWMPLPAPPTQAP